MLQSVDAPLVMFTTRAHMKLFQVVRKKMNLPTKFIIYEDVWSMMKELESERNRSYAYNYMHVQPGLDKESYHTPSLYAVWNLKPFFVHKAATLNPFNSSYFIYTDAGAWRDRAIPNWPDVSFVKMVFNTTGDLMLFGQLEANIHFSPWDNVIQGTWFSGSLLALERYKKAFYDLHDKRMDANIFIGKRYFSLFLSVLSGKIVCYLLCCVASR